MVYDMWVSGGCNSVYVCLCVSLCAPVCVYLVCGGWRRSQGVGCGVEGWNQGVGCGVEGRNQDVGCGVWGRGAL